MSFIQGSTIPSNSKVVIHWSGKFKSRKNAGMAYVALGRSEELKDIYIKGEVDPKGIHASPEALEETKRIEFLIISNVNNKGNTSAILADSTHISLNMPDL